MYCIRSSPLALVPLIHSTSCGLPGVSVRSGAGDGVRRGRFFAGSRGDPAICADAVVTAVRGRLRRFASVAVAVVTSSWAPAAAAGVAAAAASNKIGVCVLENTTVTRVITPTTHILSL